MADDRARKLAESALNRLAAELEAGKSETLKNYLATMGKFRGYSWGNVLLIASQKPAATRVAGTHTWNKLGRHCGLCSCEVLVGWGTHQTRTVRAEGCAGSRPPLESKRPVKD